MTLLRASLLLFVVSCTPAGGQRGDVGQQGAPGEQGVRGPTGPSGAPGASGVCDVSSCPQPTSIDGLAGGAVGGTTTLSSLVVSGAMTLDSGSTPLPHGIIVSRGGKQTSVGGFYCGNTSFTVNGLLGVAGATVPSGGVFGVLRMAKNHCEVTCGHPAAHPCLTTEVLQSIMLGGGSDAFTANAPNPAVPMAPTGVYWVLPAEGNTECSEWVSGPGLFGVVYSLIANEGHLKKEDCQQDHSLLCCL